MEKSLLQFDIGISGSTASGKSEFAKRLAEAFGGAVVNCDSVQVYKDHRIGGAIPSESLRNSIPHYLFEVFGGDVDNLSLIHI